MKGRFHVGLRGARKLDLGFLRRVLELLQSQTIVAQVDTILLFELIGQIVDDALVEILTAEEGVAIGRLDLEYAVADLEHRDVKSAAAEIVDRDLAGALLLKSISQRGRSGFVDDPQHVEASDAARVLCRLALGVVEIGRNRDNGLRDLRAEMGFRRLLHFRKDEGADLARAIFFSFNLDPGVAIWTRNDLVRDHALILLRHRVVVAPADQALDREDRVLGISDALPLRRLSDEDFAGIGKGNHRRGRPCPLRILDDFRLVAFHHGDARIGRSEIDSDCLSHDVSPFHSGTVKHPRRSPILSLAALPDRRGRRASSRTGSRSGAERRALGARKTSRYRCAPSTHAVQLNRAAKTLPCARRVAVLNAASS